ncbi:hypothetical protein MSSIT_3071 [Methanosarcina siciliae T4/M]|uniref:Uncharacterized protein n=1 Tax=Methanosarcina siciliae T4/M TaxID=1434120 RepID=A0A0E3P9I2_9EURY|nr:hypothetical protein MSSIT_3071 [Methanosarcina siciliae T4/M]
MPFAGIGIRKQDPLKQGLKPQSSRTGAILFGYSKARSTKTRIETALRSCDHRRGTYSKARSTKTRIETSSAHDNDSKLFIRKQDPLKQGLKQIRTSRSSVQGNRIRKQDPLKQGLKLIYTLQRGIKRHYSKARSTKTRIETEKWMQSVIEQNIFESKIH